MTVAEALAAVAVRLSYVQRYAHVHTCKGRGCTTAPIVPILGWEWRTCPVGALANAGWQAVSELHACADVSTLADWPLGWAAWVCHSLIAIRVAQTAERARLIEEASK